ncbi:MAG: SEC-C domain-containing protein, partial [Lachnospiraceae bacterium]|nr:SEC-C domain-containing protein [Lachnospiraceae bacterium]
MGIFKIGRNDPCWCGSGRKYKQCHEAFDERLKSLKAEGKKVPTRKMIKTPAQIEGIRKAGLMNTKVLDHVEPFVKEGVSTEELNKIVHEYTLSLGCTP